MKSMLPSKLGESVKVSSSETPWPEDEPAGPHEKAVGV